MRPTVNTEKHILQFTTATVASGAIANLNLAIGTASPSATSHVREGAVISAVYVEIWVTSDDATQGAGVVSVEKRPANATAMTYAQSVALNSYSNKKNLLFCSEGLTPPNVQSGIPLIRQWIKIPKGKQRFSLNDYLVVNVSGIGNGANYCGMMIYKEQF